jgi:hypothetical protein
MAGGDGFDSLSAHISWWYDWNADDGADHTATGATYFNMFVRNLLSSLPFHPSDSTTLLSTSTLLRPL